MVEFRENRLGRIAGELSKSASSLIKGEESSDERFDFISDEVKHIAVDQAKKGNYDTLNKLSQEEDFDLGRFGADYLSALEEGADLLINRANKHESIAEKFLEGAEEGAKDMISRNATHTDKELGESEARTYLSYAEDSVEYLITTEPSDAGQVQDRRTAFKMINLAKNFTEEYNLDEKTEHYDSVLEEFRETDREMGMSYGRRKARKFNDVVEILDR